MHAITEGDMLQTTQELLKCGRRSDFSDRRKTPEILLFYQAVELSENWFVVIGIAPSCNTVPRYL
jgi:hypothetical protein